MHDSQMPEADLISAAQSTLPPPETPSVSAGQVLRQAREAAQIHRASLAAMLKVPAKKIEALENDDWQALPDLAFTRALASSICRQLKIDPQTVLALLPTMQQQAPQTPATLAEDKALAATRQKLSTSPHAQRRASGLFVATAALFVVGAVAAAWWWQGHRGQPQGDIQSAQDHQPTVQAQQAHSLTLAATVVPIQSSSTLQPASAAVLMASAAEGSASAAQTLASTLQPAPSVLPTVQGTLMPASTPAPGGLGAGGSADARQEINPAAQVSAASPAVLTLQAKAESWVQVRDAQNKLHVSRSLRAGDRVQVQGQPPYRIWTGRAEALQVFWQGAPVTDFDGKTGALRVQIPAAAPAVNSAGKAAPASPQH
jgi:cytoskeleton protein RodZ